MVINDVWLNRCHWTLRLICDRISNALVTSGRISLKHMVIKQTLVGRSGVDSGRISRKGVHKGMGVRFADIISFFLNIV